jgi:GTP cyclohydrolase II
MKGPFAVLRETLPAAATASVQLAKLAGLLPAALLYRGDDGSDLSRVSAEDIATFHEATARDLAVVMRARLPLDGVDDAELAAFRPADGGPEHYALLIGKLVEPVLARIHSECFTGDVLGSLRCDCGEQLRGAIAAIAKAGGGVLLYLAQEGRGIGLMNKLRAYRLQDEGFDTFEANRRLGFESDERYYDIAARILMLLGISAVRLMTNNPAKVKAIESAGIKVAERVPHAFPASAHNRDYLRAKKDGGHLL